ncbi:hypothetical protein C1I98_14890 [Spongiactinospora gelatinilytica]|uniref:Uncharacterized protein n=1 Tax=Spongiactinospora gelatinilytica TaxID=2666298 RepID=A0A2W2GDP0_9ACTN|nr:hypothetical protein [Spongiactinospora gelatinilytica]PZG45982.1 hypothetical protein C1I98_14890 [Spongiactinospora gelatinilytica]
MLVVLAIGTTLFGFAPGPRGDLADRGLRRCRPVLGNGAARLDQGLPPFDHIPRMPIEEFHLTPLMMLTVLAVALALIGLYGFRRRDLEGT